MEVDGYYVASPRNYVSKDVAINNQISNNIGCWYVIVTILVISQLTQKADISTNYSAYGNNFI